MLASQEYVDLDNLEEFKQYVINEYPKEAVGFVVDNHFIPLENIHPQPNDNFRVSPADYLQYENQIESIVHSHTIKPGDKPKADFRSPSTSDLQLYKSFRIQLGIVATDGVGVTDMLDVPIKPSVAAEDRTWASGAMDSFTLLDLPYHPFAHSDEIMDKRIPNFFYANGYKWLEDFTLQENDVILFRLTKVIDHLGIYLGDDKMLHQLPNRRPEITTYSKWEHMSTHKLRKV